MAALPTPPPVGDDQSVLRLLSAGRVPAFVVDRAANRPPEQFGVAVDRSPLLDADGPPAPRALADALETALADAIGTVEPADSDTHDHLDFDTERAREFREAPG